MTKNEPVVLCDFCTKSQHEVREIVQGQRTSRFAMNVSIYACNSLKKKKERQST